MGLVLVLLRAFVLGQLDIEGHKQILKQEKPKLDVKKEKSFQVFEAVAGNNTSNFIPIHADIEDDEDEGRNVTEMVSYSTKVSVSMKQESDGKDLIDRQSDIPVTGGLIPASIPSGHIRFENVSFSYPTRPDVSIMR